MSVASDTRLPLEVILTQSTSFSAAFFPRVFLFSESERTYEHTVRYASKGRAFGHWNDAIQLEMRKPSSSETQETSVLTRRHSSTEIRRVLTQMLNVTSLGICRLIVALPLVDFFKTKNATLYVDSRHDEAQFVARFDGTVDAHRAFQSQIIHQDRRHTS